MPASTSRRLRRAEFQRLQEDVLMTAVFWRLKSKDLNTARFDGADAETIVSLQTETETALVALEYRLDDLIDLCEKDGS